MRDEEGGDGGLDSSPPTYEEEGAVGGRCICLFSCLYHTFRSAASLHQGRDVDFRRHVVPADEEEEQGDSLLSGQGFPIGLSSKGHNGSLRDR